MSEIYRVLENEHILLRPIAPDDRENLRRNAKFNEIWKNTTLMNVYTDSLFDMWFNLAFNNSQGTTQKCFVLEKLGELIGSSRYYGIDSNRKEISIGYTWITPRYWGSSINPSIKYLMLKNAFEQGFEKVFFHTDVLNEHSQSAIKKLGAKFTRKEIGNKIRPDGTMRDTVEFVVDKKDWKEVSEKLLFRIKL